METTPKKLFQEASEKMPVVGILRDIPLGAEEICIQTSIKAGLKIIEVTMNTMGAKEILSNLKKAAGNSIIVGAGTVRSLNDLENAIEVGAQFIVSPTTFPEIIKKGNEANLPMIPGALTPTEIELAYNSGAACVKVFPVDALGGKNYIKSLRGPFRDIPLLACGGVSAENAKDYLDAGSNLLAFGGSIFSKKLMEENNWELIGQKLETFLKACRSS